MKFKGRSTIGAPVEYVPIIRHDFEFVLEIEGVTDMTEFEELYPQPLAPEVRLVDGTTQRNLEDRMFRKAIDIWWKQRSDWMMLKSLTMRNPDLTLDTVDPNKPNTWANWEKELKDAGFTPGEMNRIVAALYTVNSLNEAALKAARERFFLEKEQAALSSQKDGVANTSSGEPAKD